MSVVPPYLASNSLLTKKSVDGKVSLTPIEYVNITNVSKPYEFPISVGNAIRDKAIQDRILLPFFQEDIEDIIENGVKVGEKLKDSFGKKAVKEDNSLTLEDVKN